MTPQRLELLAKLLRLGDNSYTAALFVRCHGFSIREAAAITRMAPSNLSRALKRIRELDAAIQVAYEL